MDDDFVPLEAYALVVDGHKLSMDEHRMVREMLDNLCNIINGATAFTASVDLDYADPARPSDAVDK